VMITKMGHGLYLRDQEIIGLHRNLLFIVLLGQAQNGGLMLLLIILWCLFSQ